MPRRQQGNSECVSQRFSGHILADAGCGLADVIISKTILEMHPLTLHALVGVGAMFSARWDVGALIICFDTDFEVMQRCECSRLRLSQKINKLNHFLGYQRVRKGRLDHIGAWRCVNILPVARDIGESVERPEI